MDGLVGGPVPFTPLTGVVVGVVDSPDGTREWPTLLECSRDDERDAMGRPRERV